MHLICISNYLAELCANYEEARTVRQVILLVIILGMVAVIMFGMSKNDADADGGDDGDITN